MGFLKSLLGQSNPATMPYVVEGIKLTKQLIALLDLPDWANGMPRFTEREARAIDRELQGFQQLSDSGAQARVRQQQFAHDVSADPIQRALGADALRQLAGPGMQTDWDLDGLCPDDWKMRVSTYLKAWAMGLDPDVLLDLAELLALAGYADKAGLSVAIVSLWFPDYAPRFFGSKNDSEVAADIIRRAGEVGKDISKARLRLHGLNVEDSVLATCKLLFSPTLRKHFGVDESLEWTEQLIAKLADGDRAAFSVQYNSRLPEVKAALESCPKYSMSRPPWSMASLDMRIGLIPWVSPAFDNALAVLLQNGSAPEKHFGEVLPFAFFLHGGPGNTSETAFRVCAPSQAVRSSAEHWLMRGFLNRREQGPHETVTDEEDRTFSLHRYTDQDGAKKKVFFSTTDSFGREEEDFEELLFS